MQLANVPRKLIFDIQQSVRPCTFSFLATFPLVFYTVGSEGIRAVTISRPAARYIVTDVVRNV